MNTYRYLTIAAIAISLTACQQDDDLQGTNDSDAVKVNVSAGAIPQSRVTYGTDGSTTFDNGDQIRIINTTRQGAGKTTKYNEVYTKSSNGWTASPYVAWEGTGANTFHAVHPISDDADYNPFIIPSDQSTASLFAEADWMSAKVSAAKADNNGAIDITLNHMLAKVTVNFVFNDEFSVGTHSIDNVEIYTMAESPEATYNDDGSIAEITGYGNYGSIYPFKNSDMSYSAIVFPGEYAGNSYLVSLDVDNEYSHYVIAGSNAVLTGGLQPGKHYTFTVRVGKHAATISSVSVADWGTTDDMGQHNATIM